VQPENTEDKLAIYRTQAKAVAKKKEQKETEIKRLEQEKATAERAMQDKEGQYEKTKGQKYLKRDDFRQYAANLREKNNNYKTMGKHLEEIKQEVKVLEGTRDILKSRAGNVEDLLKDLEKKKGITGYSSIDDQI
jgi:intraflagellar transport protein 81